MPKSKHLKTLVFSFLLILVGLGVFNFIPQDKHLVRLSQEEIQWLSILASPLIYAPDPAFSPLEYFEDGQLMGIATEYLELIRDRLGIQVKVAQLPNWTEVINKAQNCEVDFPMVVHPTNSRKGYWSFTDSYLDVPNVIILRNAMKRELNLQDLSHRKVAVVRSYAVNEYISKKYRDIEVVHVSSLLEGLTRVSFSELDAAIADLPVAVYYTQKEL